MNKTKNKGITLVALVITIIILLILAGITILQLTGSRLFEKAQLAEQKSKGAQEKEEGILEDYENKIGEYVDGSRDTVSYCTTPAGTTSTASPSSLCVVVENYKNGSEWYRVWSDGWIEQGGRALAGPSAEGKKINFIKEFTDNNYTITTNVLKNSSSGLSSYSVGTVQKDNNGFYASGTWINVNGMGFGNVPFDWYACGY